MTNQTAAEMRSRAVELRESADNADEARLVEHAANQRAGADALGHLPAIREAWTVPGHAPSFHQSWQQKVRQGWPSLASAIEHGARPSPSPAVRLRILRAIDEAEVLTDEHDARALAEALIPFIAAERADAGGTA